MIALESDPTDLPHENCDRALKGLNFPEQCSATLNVTLFSFNALPQPLCAVQLCVQLCVLSRYVLYNYEAEGLGMNVSLPPFIMLSHF